MINKTITSICLIIFINNSLFFINSNYFFDNKNEAMFILSNLKTNGITQETIIRRNVSFDN